jgi:DUF4097 and DUF4098 domain-containing protein YvlB
MSHPSILVSCGLFAAAAALAVGAAGCTVQASVKTQTKFQGTAVQKQATNAYNGEVIEIQNANGNVVVNGGAGTTNVNLSAKPFAFADDKAHEADADGAISQVNDTITIDESVAGKITIRCGQASHSVGTAGVGTTGCDDFTVNVPTTVSLTVVAENGSLQATGLTSAQGTTLQLKSANGEVTATGISGSANVSSDNGNVAASVTPGAGSSLAVTTGNGDIDLKLPSSFAAKTIAFSAGKGVTVTGFADLTATSTSRNPSDENAAQSVSAKASDLGTLTVSPQ